MFRKTRSVCLKRGEGIVKGAIIIMTLQLKEHGKVLNDALNVMARANYFRSIAN